MKEKVTISKIMTADVFTVKSNQQLLDAYNIITKNKIRHLPVVSDKKIVGMLSKTDIDKASFISAFDEEEINNAIYENLTIEQVMTKRIKSVQASDSIADVTTLLSKYEFHAVPVLKGDKLVGIVSSTDLIKYLVSLI